MTLILSNSCHWLKIKKNNVNELFSQLNSLYWSKIKEFIFEMGKKYKVHIVHKENDDDYFHSEISINKICVKLSIDYDEDGYYCQLETKKRLPKFITDDFDISEELNDKENRSDCIWRYDTYKESLLRFDRVLGRLLDIKNNIQSLHSGK